MGILGKFFSAGTKRRVKAVPQSKKFHKMLSAPYPNEHPLHGRRYDYVPLGKVRWLKFSCYKRRDEALKRAESLRRFATGSSMRVVKTQNGWCIVSKSKQKEFQTRL